MKKIGRFLVFVGFLGVVLGRTIGAEEGLVGYWSFDEGEGNIAYDSSGMGNNGTIYGATWVDGKVGKALSFDGVDDFVSIPHSPSVLSHK